MWKRRGDPPEIFLKIKTWDQRAAAVAALMCHLLRTSVINIFIKNDRSIGGPSLSHFLRCIHVVAGRRSLAKWNPEERTVSSDFAIFENNNTDSHA